MDEVMLQNTKKRFENLKKLADKNNGYVEAVFYDIEIDEILAALNIAIAVTIKDELEELTLE